MIITIAYSIIRSKTYDPSREQTTLGEFEVTRA